MVNRKIQLLVINLTVGLSFQSCLDNLGQAQLERYDGCVPEKCKGGKWVPDKDKISPKCLTCNAWGDPHFEAFNGARFDWQYECNTALAQQGNSTTPNFGVFMDFDQIDEVAYVGAPTTYQDDKNTKVVLYPKAYQEIPKIPILRVNGIGPEIEVKSTPTLIVGTSVYAWTHLSAIVDTANRKKPKTCVRLYGKTKILVELCDSIIHIWALPKGPLFDVELGGLCGSTDTGSRAFRGKKLVARNGVKYPDPGNWKLHPDKAFGDSWKASDQTKSNCRGKRKRSLRKGRSVDDLHTKCDIESNSLIGDHHNMCLGVHKGQGSTGDDHLDACKYDLCMVANDTEHRRLGITVDMMLDLHSEIHARTRAHMYHVNPFFIMHGYPQPLQWPFQSSSQTVQNQPFQRPFQSYSQTVQNQPIQRPYQSSSQTVQTQPFQSPFQRPFQSSSQTSASQIYLAVYP